MNSKQKIVPLKYLFYKNVYTFVPNLVVRLFFVTPSLSALDRIFTNNNTPSMPL